MAASVLATMVMAATAMEMAAMVGMAPVAMASVTMVATATVAPTMGMAAAMAPATPAEAVEMEDPLLQLVAVQDRDQLGPHHLLLWAAAAAAQLAPLHRAVEQSRLPDWHCCMSPLRNLVQFSVEH